MRITWWMWESFREKWNGYQHHFFGGSDRNVCIHVRVIQFIFFRTCHTEQWWHFMLCCVNSCHPESPERRKRKRREGCGGPLTIATDYIFFNIGSIFCAHILHNVCRKFGHILHCCFLPFYFTPGIIRKKSKFDIIRKFVILIHVPVDGHIWQSMWSICDDNGRKM